MKTTYQRYWELVESALKVGYTPAEVMAELNAEKRNIQNICERKLVELSRVRTPYPKREAVRLATECAAIIDRICTELSAGTFPKEINA